MQIALETVIAALRPLLQIARAYDMNALDDEARRFWGRHDENENTRDPREIELYAGRGGTRLLTLAHALRARELHDEIARSRDGFLPTTAIESVMCALAPLVHIANAYEMNALDDEARRFWGRHDENENLRDRREIVLYSGRGGTRLLTLADAFAGRDVHERLKGLFAEGSRRAA